MKLEQTGIYPFIKDYPAAKVIYKFNKGDIVTAAIARNEDYWYLVEGSIEVMATSYNDKRIHVDDNVEDEFTGHLSKYWGQDLRCDCVAETDCQLIRIPNALFEKLLRENEKFKVFFYFKMSSRLYDMYRGRMAIDLFSPRQRYAAHLITHMRDGVCYTDNISKECSRLRISRRNLYNILNSFAFEKMISYEQTGVVEITDEKALREVAQPMLEFLDNR